MVDRCALVVVCCLLFVCGFSFLVVVAYRRWLGLFVVCCLLLVDC